MAPRSASLAVLLLALAAALVEAGTPGYALGAQVVNASSVPGTLLNVIVDEQDRIYFWSEVPASSQSGKAKGLYITSGASSLLTWDDGRPYGFTPSVARGGFLYFSAKGSGYFRSCILQMSPLINITASRISLLAGSCSVSSILDGTGPNARFGAIEALSVAFDGTLYVIDQYVVRRVSSLGVTSTMTPTGDFEMLSLTNPLSPITFYMFGTAPKSLTLSPAGHLYFVSSYILNVGLYIFAPGQAMQSLTSTGCADGPIGTASFKRPRAIACDASGSIYIADDCLLGGFATLRIINNGSVATVPLSGVPVSNLNNYETLIASLSAGKSATVVFSTNAFSLYNVITGSDFFPAFSFSLKEQILVGPGFYSTGTILPVACPAGRYGVTAGLTSSACTGVCPAGSECTNATSSPIQCPAGKWSAAGQSACSLCDAGRYGATAGLTSFGCSGACPAGSICTSGTSSPTLCSVGTWSAAGSSLCLPCSNGTYGNTTGLTTASCSGSCTFSPPGYVCSNLKADSFYPPHVVLASSGATQPALCPPGYYCPDSGTVLPCPAGTYVCLYGVGDCSWPVNTSQFKQAMPNNIWNDAFGNFFLPLPLELPVASSTYIFLVQGFIHSSCSGFVLPGFDSGLQIRGSLSQSNEYRVPVSPTGGYIKSVRRSAFSTSIEYSPSSPCPLGSFCPGASPAVPCRPGTYTPIVARASCLLCASGTYQPLAGQAYCDGFCPVGTYSVRAGAVNASTCSPCPAGTFGQGEGASSCTPCPSGSFSAALGATSPATCIPCPLGTSTLQDGAYSPKACVTGLAFVCPVGQQPSSPATPASAADCAPLACAPPLQPLPDGSGCSGCGAGTHGAPGACQACASGALCPGLLSLPLFNFSAALVAGGPAPSGCPLLLPPQPAAPGGGPPTAASAASLSTIAGGSVVGLLLLVTLLVTLYNRLSGLKLPPRLKPYVQLVDLMSPGLPVRVGAEKILAEREKSTLGASATLLATGALGVLAAVLATQRAESNTLSQQSLGVLRGGPAAAAPWPWATASTGAAAGAALPAPPSGVFLRVTASGEPGQCQPSALTTAGLSAGAWALLPSSTCTGTDAGAGTISQFTLACPACMFSPTSAVSFLLPYSCQSLLVEAGAVDADGSLAVLSLPPGDTSAPGSGGALQGGFTWALAPLLSQLNNTVSPGQSRKGWQLLSQGATSAPPQQLLPPSAGANGTLTVLPLSSAVTVRITLELQPYVATTTLTELTSVLQLLSSIVGFQGIIFSVVGLLFGVLAQARNASQQKLVQPEPAAALPQQAAAPVTESELAIAHNPLLEASAAPLPASAGTVPAATWTKHTEGEDTWYEGPEGQLVWKLPRGAVVGARFKYPGNDSTTA